MIRLTQYLKDFLHGKSVACLVDGEEMKGTVKGVDFTLKQGLILHLDQGKIPYQTVICTLDNLQLEDVPTSYDQLPEVIRKATGSDFFSATHSEQGYKVKHFLFDRETWWRWDGMSWQGRPKRFSKGQA